MILRNPLVITSGLLLAAVFVVVQGAGCNLDCPVPYLDSGEYKVNAGRNDEEWLDDAILTVNRDAGTAKIRYTRDGSTYEVTYTLDE